MKTNTPSNCYFRRLFSEATPLETLKACCAKDQDPQVRQAALATLGKRTFDRLDDLADRYIVSDDEAQDQALLLEAVNIRLTRLEAKSVVEYIWSLVTADGSCDQFHVLCDNICQLIDGLLEANLPISKGWKSLDNRFSS